MHACTVNLQKSSEPSKCTEVAKIQQENEKDSNKVRRLGQFELKCYLLYLCCPFVDKQLVFVNLLAGQQVGCNQLVSEQ